MSLIISLKLMLSCDVVVLYAGKKTTVIGPPRSMANLADLLEPHYSVFRSKNITFNKKVIHSEAISSYPPEKSFDGYKAYLSNKLKALIYSLKTKMKSINMLHQMFMLFTLVRFNIFVYFISLVNKRAKIIITQPFVLKVPFFNIGNRLIYIRRGNVDWGVRQLINDDFNIKTFFDGSFFSFNNVKLVYLVDLGVLSKKYTVIPNHFDADSFNQLATNRTCSKVFFVGTWSTRKGGRLLIDLSTQITPFLEHKIEVYGTLGSEPELNKSLIESSGITYCGVVEEPYKKMSKGDVFISLSLVEGLQRSLIEAMLSGCIIIAFTRPDSLSVKECKGVFIVDEFDAFAFEKLIKSILDLPKKEREFLGEQCAAFAKSRYSATSVLSKWKVILDA